MALDGALRRSLAQSKNRWDPVQASGWCRAFGLNLKHFGPRMGTSGVEEVFLV